MSSLEMEEIYEEVDNLYKDTDEYIKKKIGLDMNEVREGTPEDIKEYLKERRKRLAIELSKRLNLSIYERLKRRVIDYLKK